MLIFLIYIVLLGFVEISYHVSCMTCQVIEKYKGEHLSNILVFEFQHITKKDRICVIKAAFSQGPGWFHESKV
jgi:hypothetical protein